MATIGSSRRSARISGEIVTLSLQAKGVRIIAEPDHYNDKAPSHRVFVGRADYAERERYAEWCRLSAGFPRVSGSPRSA